jgi:hypothetical protein
MIQPKLDTVPAFYRGYVDYVKHLDLFEAMTWSLNETQQLIKSIDESQGQYAYANGKWTIKELLCHVIDAERIFCYRALRFARKDSTPLAGFDEELYVPESNAHQRSLTQIAGELLRIRETSIDLYRSFTPEMLERTGSANNTEISVLTLGFVVAGHDTHHRAILNTRYLAKK